MFKIIRMLRQAEKWFPDLGTMVSGHLLIYVVSAKGNHERIIPGVILFSTGLCIEWLLKTGLYSHLWLIYEKYGNSDRLLKQILADAIQEGNAQYEIFVGTTENQSGRYLFNRPNNGMNNYIKSKKHHE